jgi:hypothetical protein
MLPYSFNKIITTQSLSVVLNTTLSVDLLSLFLGLFYSRVLHKETVRGEVHPVHLAHLVLGVEGLSLDLASFEGSYGYIE